jgi:hypothetical protein
MSQRKSIDVYLGRGPRCYNKPGTKTYRDIINLYAQDFCPNATKSDKSTFIDNVWFQMHLQGFRFFVSSVSEDNKYIWKEASNWKVKERIGHALRDHRKRYFKDKTITNGESNSQAANLEQHTNQTEALTIPNNDQSKITALEAGQEFEDQKNIYLNEVPSSAYVDMSGWKSPSEKSNRCDEIRIFISHGRDCSEASSSIDNIRCNIFTPQNFREKHSPIKPSDIVLLNASDEDSKGNESRLMYLFIGYTIFD